MIHYNGVGEMDDPKMEEGVEMERRRPLHVVRPPPFRIFLAPFIKNILCSIKFSFLEVISIHFSVLTYICMSYVMVKHKNIQCCYLL